MLGILGGMGPLATADFMRKLVLETPALRDQNHIPAVVWSVPQIADRSEHIVSGAENPFPMLLKGMNGLKSLGASIAVIPCNTAHYWVDELSKQAGLPVLHIVEAVSAHIKSALPHGGMVGLLATTGTINARIYDGMFDDRAWSLLVPGAENQSELMQGIRQVKAGDTEKGRNIFLRQVAALREQGADLVILGCTELPSVLEQDSYLVDSLTVLARRCVNWYGANFGFPLLNEQRTHSAFLIKNR